MDHARFVTLARQLALKAGEAILEIYGEDDMGVETKDDDSPVTRADVAADEIISAGLRAEFPGLSLVTEEQAATHDVSASRFAIVDPLDGTKEFVKRRGDFTVNIALVEDGVPTLGVVYAPAKGRLFYTRPDGQSVEEEGPFTDAPVGEVRPIRVATPGKALRVVASKSHRTPETDDYIGRYTVADTVSAGSSLKFCLVATGEADLYPRLGPTMEWDTAAGDAVLRGAGGHVVRLDDLTPLRYGKGAFRNPTFLAYAPGIEPIAAP